MGIGSLIFGSKGYHDPYDDISNQQNREAEQRSFSTLKALQTGQYQGATNLGRINSNTAQQLRSFDAVNGNPFDAGQQEIERRRRALGMGQQSVLRGIDANAARRGLSNSAGALYARANADRDYQNQLANFEGSTGDIMASALNRNLANRGALLNQLGGGLTSLNQIGANAQLPQIQHVSLSREGSGGLLGKVGNLVGGNISKLAGSFFNPIGGALNAGASSLGQSAVGGVSDFFKKKQGPITMAGDAGMYA